jgi:hypothetical protein
MYEFILKKGSSVLQPFVEPELRTNMPVSRVLHSMLLRNVFMNRKALG